MVYLLMALWRDACDPWPSRTRTLARLTLYSLIALAVTLAGIVVMVFYV